MLQPSRLQVARKAACLPEQLCSKGLRPQSGTGHCSCSASISAPHSNLKASLETGGAAPAANCMGNCAQQWPTPPGCDPAAPTVYCCQVQAERDYCQSLCRFEGSVLPSTCRAVAAAEYVVDWMNCSMLDDEIF